MQNLPVFLFTVGVTLLWTSSTSKAVLVPEKNATRSFVVGKNCFLKDGQPFQYISGSFHYWRQPPEYWQDTFLKMRAAGLNAVETYLNWHLHEPEPLQYNFNGDIDIRRFLTMAQSQGLLVVLRPGPFIDAEVDQGGLPYWLLRINPLMKLRSSDPSYLKYVERWFRKLFPLIKDLLYANGGPIISVQIENEYGSVGSDVVYKEFLKNLTIELLGTNIVLFTTDGAGDSYVKGGQINGTLTTVDFGAGSDVSQCFAIERKYNPDGPLVNSEFYPGWLDHWGSPFVTVDYQSVVKTMQDMLAVNASFNTYMFYGGTNYGFVAGSNQGNIFEPVITSYDYDAPLSEAGDPTVKYMKIRELFGKYVPLPPGPVPPARPKSAYGKFVLSYTGSIFDHLNDIRPKGPVMSPFPLSFEVLEQPYGFVLYRLVITSYFTDPAVLVVNGLHDRAVVFVDQRPIGILSRTTGQVSISIYVEMNQTLDILVHNEGRVCIGPINDMKGILGNVTINKQVLTGWQMFPLDLPGFPVDKPRPFGFKQTPQTRVKPNIPGFYSGSFNVDIAQDTFLKLKGWRNGYAFINGRNLGRYWPVQGPQETLYVPGVYLHQGAPNIIELFEVEHSPCRLSWECMVEFVDTPVLNGTVPTKRVGSSKFARFSFPKL